MADFKYIVLRMDYGMGLLKDLPIIFPADFVHKEVADLLCKHEGMQNAVAISAGEVQFDTLACFGESTTLKLKSRGKEDEQLIQSFPYFHGLSDKDEEPTPKRKKKKVSK